MPRKIKRIPPPKMPSKEYRTYWRLVDGAVRNAFDMHPDYLTVKGQHRATARNSVVKRVVGAIIGFHGEKSRNGKIAPGRRSGD